MVTTEANFYARANRAGDCLIWGGKSRIGPYGRVGYAGEQWLAHRLSYYFQTGVSPEVVRHSCDTPLCVEPAHLLAGSHADNVADKVGRKRHRFHESHPMGKLTADQVAEMRVRYETGGIFMRELAEYYGIRKQQVSRIINEKQWKGD